MIVEAKLRKEMGSSKSRKLRTTGFVPAVVYGAGKTQEILSVNARSLGALLKEPSSMSRVVSLDVEGNQESVILKEIQFHPVTSLPLHVDFLRVSNSTPVCVSIPLLFSHEDKSPGVKRGGVLNIVKRHVDVLATASTIPTHVIVDLSGVEANTSVTTESLSLPEGVHLASLARLTLATVVAKKQKE